MSDKQDERPAAPPVLQRATPGARPATAGAPAAAPAAVSPAAPPRAGQAAKGSFGLAPREVTAAAAVAAGLEAEGSLEKESPLHLYYLATAAQATGRLTLAAQKGSYALTFRKGTVEHVASTYPDDHVGRFLVAKGLVRPEQLAQAEAAGGGPGGDLVGALVAQKLIDPARTYQALQEHGAGLAWRALAGDNGTWRWEPGAVPPPSSFPLGHRWGMLCDAVRRLDGATLRRRLGARASRPAVKAGGRIQLGDLRLTPQETRVASLFDGVRSVENLCQAQPGEADLVRRVALLLVETELLTFGPAGNDAVPTVAPDQGPAAPGPSDPAKATPHSGAGTRPPPAARPSGPAPARPPPAPPPPRQAAEPASPRSAAAPAGAKPSPAASPRQANPPRPAAAPGPPRPAGPDLSLAGLKAAFDRIKEADHFQVLGVKREAAASQIKMAYFALAKIYHPDSAPQDDPPEARKLRADIFGKVSEAWGVLGEDQSRAQYLEELRLGGTADMDVMAILKSEEVFQMAEILVKSRKYGEALKKLEEAIALCADEPEYFVWKAWVEFLLAPADRKKPQQAASAQVIEGALKKNAKCMAGYLFLGKMAKLVGDISTAERHLKRGLAIDENRAELQRELKYLKR